MEPQNENTNTMEWTCYIVAPEAPHPDTFPLYKHDGESKWLPLEVEPGGWCLTIKDARDAVEGEYPLWYGTCQAEYVPVVGVNYGEVVIGRVVSEGVPMQEMTEGVICKLCNRGSDTVVILVSKTGAICTSCLADQFKLLRNDRAEKALFEASASLLALQNFGYRVTLAVQGQLPLDEED